MAPQQWVLLEQMPLTASGKVDRKALPAPETSFLQPSHADVGALPLEDALRVIWSEVLGVSEIGIHDNFFELGGHSLLLMQVVARVREAFGVELSLQAFFESPTMAATAAIIQQKLDHPESNQDIDDVLQMLEHMTADEVEEQLPQT
jgi:acyl carrier protein